MNPAGGHLTRRRIIVIAVSGIFYHAGELFQRAVRIKVITLSADPAPACHCRIVRIAEIIFVVTDRHPASGQTASLIRIIFSANQGIFLELSQAIERIAVGTNFINAFQSIALLSEIIDLSINSCPAQHLRACLGAEIIFLSSIDHKTGLLRPGLSIKKIRFSGDLRETGGFLSICIIISGISLCHPAIPGNGFINKIICSGRNHIFRRSPYQNPCEK